MVILLDIYKNVKMKNKVFIIAELSANHGNCLETALKTVEAAAEIGADAIKLQTYKADTITLDSKNKDFIVGGGTIWDGKSLYELYEEASLPWDWHIPIFKKAKELGIECFSSPFDISAVDFLEKIGCSRYKIASFEITDYPLLKRVAATKKPVIISTGVSTKTEIENAVKILKQNGTKDITILKCTSSYPAPIEEANLEMIKTFKNDFNLKTGLSDHTEGIVAPVVATSFGATMIEKHFILDKSVGGPDSSFSLDKDQFKEMILAVRQAEQAIGNSTYELTEKQINSRKFMRSLYASKNIKKGDFFSEKNIKSVRPSFGLHTMYYDQIIGKQSNMNFKKGDRLNETIL